MNKTLVTLTCAALLGFVSSARAAPNDKPMPDFTKGDTLGTCAGEKSTCEAEQGIEALEFSTAKPVPGTCVSGTFSCEVPKRTYGGVQRTCASEKRAGGTA